MKYEWDKREEPVTIVSSSTGEVISINKLLLENQKLKDLLRGILNQSSAYNFFIPEQLHKQIQEVLK